MTDDVTDDALRLVRAITEPDDIIEIRVMESWQTDDGGRGSKVRDRRWERAAEFAGVLPALRSMNVDSNAANVYFGVCPRPTRRASKSAEIRRARTLWADLDHTTPEAAAKRVAAVGLPEPSIVVDSGHGVHLYWLLAEPVDVTDPQAHAATEELLKSVQRRLGADHTQDLSRLLRLPGFLNVKGARNGAQPVPCRLVHCEPARRYSVQQLVVPEPPDGDADHHEPAEPSPKVAAILARLQAPTADRSRVDFGVCCDLIRVGVTKVAAWPLLKDKSKFAEAGEAYFGRTWDKAAAEVQGDGTIAAHSAGQQSAGRLQQNGARSNDTLDNASPAEAPPAESTSDASDTPDTSDTCPGEGEAQQEVEARQIVRPERFITPAVSGLTVPATTMAAGHPTGRWQLYLRWEDGRRQQAKLPHMLTLPDGSGLWLMPQPFSPAAGTAPAWSASARQAYMAGTASPDPAAVIGRMLAKIQHFIDLAPAHAPGVRATLALWSLLTYLYPAWDAVPYLFVGGPLASGKSRVFDVLGRLVFRPLNSSNMTAPAMFRTLNERGGTLLLDEAERLRESAPEVGELRSMLLAGYRRGGRATRLEAVGQGYRTVEFDVFGPKALASIALPPPALASRCIPIMMFRSAPDSLTPQRRIDEAAGEWQALRDDLHGLALEHGPAWLKLAAKPDAAAGFAGRHFELWQPILALASWVESFGLEGLHSLVASHAQSMIESSKDDQTPDHELVLLRALAAHVNAGRAPSPAEVLSVAKDEEPELFRHWSPTGAAGALRRYGLQTRKSGDRRYRDVTLDVLRRIERHYGLDLGIAARPTGLLPGGVQSVQASARAGASDTSGASAAPHLSAGHRPRSGRSWGDEMFEQWQRHRKARGLPPLSPPPADRSQDQGER